MTEELKYQIVAGVIDYAEKQGISQNEVAQMSKVNAGYVSAMFNNKFTTDVAGKASPIGDKWFYKIAEWAGLVVRKQYWATLPTPQFKETLHLCETSKKMQKVTTIINDSGLGKTYALDKFIREHPQHTYRVVASKEHRLPDILRELCEKIMITNGGSNANKIRHISMRIKELSRSGFKPIIIIDEAENLDMRALQLMKALYDGVVGYAGLVLIGTTQLTRSLAKLKNKDRQGMPQLYRRIKAGIRHINPVPDFNIFYSKYGIDRPLVKLLDSLCENYGELHDYLEPVLREADEQEVAITEDLFRLVHDMPKY